MRRQTPPQNGFPLLPRLGLDWAGGRGGAPANTPYSRPAAMSKVVDRNRSSTGHAGPSVEDQIDAIGFGKLQIIAILATFLFVVSDGMELIVTNLTFRALPMDWGIDDSSRGHLISTSFLGFVVGGTLGGYFGDMVGRKTMLYVHAIIFLPFTCASAMSTSLYMLLVSRLFVGFSMGIVLPTSVTYLAEVTPTDWRGKATAVLPVFSFTMGEVIVLLTGIYFMGLSGEAECEKESSCTWWRMMMIAGFFPDFVAVMLVYLYLPESPRFLISQGRVEEAQEVVRYIADFNGDGAEERLPEGFLKVETLADTSDPAKLFSDLFVSPLRDTMVLIWLLWTLTGIPLFAISYLWPIILEKQFELEATDQYWRMIIFVVVEAIGILFAFLMLDVPSIGRKGTVAIFSLLGFLFMMIASFFTYADVDTVQAAVLLVKMVSSTPYTIMYVYAAELLPTTHRNVGVSSGNAFTKLIGGVILPQIITSSLMVVGPQEESKMMMYSCGVSALMAATVALMLGRETVGRVMTDNVKESTDDEVLLATHRSSLSSLSGYQTVMD